MPTDPVDVLAKVVLEAFKEKEAREQPECGCKLKYPSILNVDLCSTCGGWIDWSKL